MKSKKPFFSCYTAFLLLNDTKYFPPRQRLSLGDLTFNTRTESCAFILNIVYNPFLLPNCYYFVLIVGIFWVTELPCVFLPYWEPEVDLSGNVTLVKEEKIMPNWKNVTVWHMTTIITAHNNYELGYHGKIKMFQETVQNN